jgi:integrase
MKESYRQAFKTLRKYTDNPYGLDRAGMNDVLERMGKDYAPASWNLYVNCFRAWYKWRNGGEEYPDSVKRLKLKRIRREDYILKKLLSDAEVKLLLKGCDHPRDRAMVAVARATGVRRGELLGMRIRDVERLPYGFKILVSGKTGSHKTPPVTREFAKLLNVWLEHHPQRDNPDCFLWIRQKEGPWGSRFDVLTPTGAQFVIKRAARNAGLKRRVHWHMLRHTEASASIKWVSRAARNLTHGWSDRGNTASIYEHIVDSDAEEEYLRKDGLVKPAKEVDAFGTVKCAYCGEDNPVDSKSCHYCNVPLSLEEAERFLKERQVLDWLSKPEVFKELEDMVKKKGKS